MVCPLWNFGWDLIVCVLGNVSRVSDRSGKLESDDHKHHKSHNTNRCDERHWCCSFKRPVFASSFVVYVFEDNEAVIKMIIEGRKSHKETCFQDPQSCA